MDGEGRPRLMKPKRYSVPMEIPIRHARPRSSLSAIADQPVERKRSRPNMGISIVARQKTLHHSQSNDCLFGAERIVSSANVFRKIHSCVEMFDIPSEVNSVQRNGVKEQHETHSEQASQASEETEVITNVDDALDKLCKEEGKLNRKYIAGGKNPDDQFNRYTEYLEEQGVRLKRISDSSIMFVNAMAGDDRPRAQSLQVHQIQPETRQQRARFPSLPAPRMGFLGFLNREARPPPRQKSKTDRSTSPCFERCLDCDAFLGETGYSSDDTIY